MSRILARETIFKLTFELCFHNPEDGCYYEEMLSENKLDEDNLVFVKEFLHNNTHLRDYESTTQK